MKYLGVLVGLMALGSCAIAAEPQKAFGFSGREIFPIEQQIGLMQASDLDGDGLVDIIVANNARSRINLLYNQTGRTNDPAKNTKTTLREINQLPPDARFRIESIASEKRISSLVVADLNSDGRPDLAYYGEPKELIIQYNQGTNVWSTPKRWPIDDGVLTPEALAVGDLNGDGRADLVLLGDSAVYLLTQKNDGNLNEPEKTPYSGSPKSMKIVDINGDGRDDLLLAALDTVNPFRFRLQNSAGQLGPEIHLSWPTVRNFWIGDLGNERKTELVTIALQSGRAQLSVLEEKPAETLVKDLKKGQFTMLPFNRTTKEKRGLVWADINGDGLTDLLAAEPDSGQLSFYPQKIGGSLGQSRSFPTLSGVSGITVADWDDDGVNDIFLRSEDERTVGVTRLDASGRIGFPKPLQIEGRPLAMVAGNLFADREPSLVVITDQEGKRFLQICQANGTNTSIKLSEQFKSNPTAIILHDADQDGLTDIVVLVQYEKIKILRQTETHKFTELDIAPPGGNIEQPWMSQADVDGDGKSEMLLPLRNFLRAVVLQTEKGPASAGKTNWTFQVKEQINGVASNSRLIGAALLLRGSQRVLLLLDAEKKALSFCERDPGGVWQVSRSIALPVMEFDRLQTIGLGQARPNSVALGGLNSVAWMAFQGNAWDITPLDGYETAIKDGFLNRVYAGDLNQDNIKDLVFLETGKNSIDIVAYHPPRQLQLGTRWRVFEERTFRNRRVDGAEPREALIADFTGDRKNDLVILVHDRILLYPQE